MAGIPGAILDQRVMTSCRPGDGRGFSARLEGGCVPSPSCVQSLVRLLAVTENGSKDRLHLLSLWPLREPREVELEMVLLEHRAQRYAGGVGRERIIGEERGSDFSVAAAVAGIGEHF